MCSQPGPTGNRSSTCILTFSPRPGKKKKLKIADGNTRSTTSAGREEAEVSGVEEKGSLVQVGEGR